MEERILLSHVLGTAGSFAVLGGQAVTNTGPTSVIGNLGVSPGTAVTGFPPGSVTGGTIHAADAVALQAQSDLTTAYNDIAGRAITADLTSQDLGGLTLTPGVYFFSSSAQLTGTLTLDAQGDPDAEFIFQIGSTLTTASSSSVQVINGGDPCEVYWQIGSSATLGTTTVFVGHILALSSISVQTGATIQGSALARNASVTLDNNVISIADCMTGTISGAKFNDLNGDGLQQLGEPMLAGYTVYIDVNSNDVLDPGESQTTTDASGNYSFTSLVPGTYRIRQLQGAGFTQTTPNPGSIDLDEGDTVTGVDFGDFLSASVSGAKFRDMNGNGVRDVSDAGIAGFTVFLDTNTNGVFDAGEVSTVSDASGNYTFTGLGPGTYTVREVQQAGFTQTTANPAAIVSTSGGNITGVAFGNFQLISVSGAKFRDMNGNGVRDVGDAGIAGFTVFLDTNTNGVFDAGEVSTVSDASGNYTFTGLGPGTYTVREVQQLGYVRMTNNPGSIVAISGGNISGVLFGNILVTDLIAVNKLLLTGRNLTNLLDGTISRQAAFVANLYETILGRAPDLEGLSYYLRLLMAGYTEQQVTDMFMASLAPAPATPIVLQKAEPKKAAAPTPAKVVVPVTNVRPRASAAKTSPARSRK